MAEPVRARRLTDAEGRRLQQVVRRGKHGPVRVRRAMIIMASASGTLVPAIARLVAADEDTVRDVIHLFNQKLPPHPGDLLFSLPSWGGVKRTAQLPAEMTCPARAGSAAASSSAVARSALVIWKPPRTLRSIALR